MEIAFLRHSAGSILGQLIFSIFFCDSFHFMDGIIADSYADDYTSYSAHKTNDIGEDNLVFC